MMKKEIMKWPIVAPYDVSIIPIINKNDNSINIANNINIEFEK